MPANASIAKTWTIKSTSLRNDAEGAVLLVTLVNPPKTLNGMTLFVPEELHTIEVPTAMANLVADLAAYAVGSTVAATYAAPVAPAAKA